MSIATVEIKESLEPLLAGKNLSAAWSMKVAQVATPETL